MVHKVAGRIGKEMNRKYKEEGKKERKINAKGWKTFLHIFLTSPCDEFCQKLNSGKIIARHSGQKPEIFSNNYLRTASYRIWGVDSESAQKN